MDIENIIRSLFPVLALKRAKARAMTRLYDAAQTSSHHKAVKSGGYSGDAVMSNAGSKLRSWCRYLDENHDIAIGILDTLCDRIIGAGLTIEPMVSSKTGVLNEKVNQQLRDLWTQFWMRPEVTRELPGNEVERMLCRSWLRDGEVLTQHVMGVRSDLVHSSAVPYSIELIEADMLPFDLEDGNIINGVEKNAWGKPIAYHLLKEHPGDVMLPYSRTTSATKRVSADIITHLKLSRRIKQTRGVPILHGVIQRLADIKDYEESERIAARIAASFTAFIRRDVDFAQELDIDATSRTFAMNSGMIFDNLLPGESVETIGTDRPNTNLGTFRNDQLRAVAAGSSTHYSAISNTYDGTYSAQRQEMVEAAPGYGRMNKFFVHSQMMPIWRNFVDMARVSGQLKIPAGIDEATLYAPMIRAPGMPWIDPKKEVEADALAVEKGFKSRPQVIRERGGDPAAVDKERENDKAAPVVEAPKAPEAPAEEPEDEENIKKLDAVIEEVKEIRFQRAVNAPEMPDVVVNIAPAPAPDVNVSNRFDMPEYKAPVVNIDNKAPDVNIAVPDQAAPVVNITNDVRAQDAPNVVVNVPTQPVPDVVVNNQVDVSVPDQPAPVVNVAAAALPEVKVNVEMKEPAKKVKFKRDKDGKITDASITDN